MKKFLQEIKTNATSKSGSYYTTFILCVLAATIFWFFNSLNKEYTTNIGYPVEFVYDESVYIKTGELPEKISLNVSGIGWNLLNKSIGLKVTPLIVQLENPVETPKITGSSLTALITDQITDITLNYVLTDTLAFSLEKRITKTFPLAIKTKDILIQKGYVLISQPELSIEKVILSGPQSLINDIDSIIYIQIDQEEINKDFDEEIQIPINNNKLIKRDPPTVSIRFHVAELTQKSISLPIQYSFLNTESNQYSIEDSLSVIQFNQIKGTVEHLPEEFSLRVIQDSFDQADSTILLELVQYPDSLYNISIDSNRFKLKISE